MLIEEELEEEEVTEVTEEEEAEEEEAIDLGSARIEHLEKFITVTMMWEKVLANQAKIEELEALMKSIVVAPTLSKEKVEEKKAEEKAKKKTSKKKAKTEKKSKKTKKKKKERKKKKS